MKHEGHTRSGPRRSGRWPKDYAGYREDFEPLSNASRLRASAVVIVECGGKTPLLDETIPRLRDLVQKRGPVRALQNGFRSENRQQRRDAPSGAGAARLTFHPLVAK